MTEKKTSLIEAMFNVQQKAPSISKATDNPFFKSKYADMSDIWDAIKPILGMEKIHIGHKVYITENGHEVLKTIFTHVPTGETVESEKLIMLSRQTAQEFGSYMTYMRRYMVTSMLGLVTENDDDGNKASEKPQVVTINQNQLTTLQNMMMEAQADEVAFLKYYGIEKLEDLPSASFMNAKSGLEKKIAQKLLDKHNDTNAEILAAG